MAMVTTVLYAVWHFNRQIPGLRLWTLSYLCGFVFTVVLLLRDQLPEWVSVLLAQGAVGLMGYLCLLGGRAYMGRGRLWHGYGVAAIVLMLAIVANIFLKMPALMLTISALAVVIFSAFILYDLKRIVDGGETNYITATLGVYLSLFNIFQSLLMLLGLFGGDRE